MNESKFDFAPWQPCNNLGWTKLQVKRRFAVELGKMLQNVPSSSSDQEVPYLKALHVQWDEVKMNDLPTMWASPNDIDALQIQTGDLLVCEGGEVGRATLVKTDPPENCIIQNSLHRVRTNEKGNVQFLVYLLRHATNQSWLDVLCNKSTIAHFTVEKFKEMWTWLPDGDTQRRIAAYLDRETAHIDALIAAKEHLLALLAEKRQALIARAVTRGLDPRVKMKDSGVEWLGEVPEHWEIERTKWLFRERNERSETGEEDLLTVSHLTGVTLRSEKDVNMFEAETTEGYKVTHPNDLVINTLWAWMGAMGISPLHGIVSPAYHVYTLSERLDPSYVDAIVRTPFFATAVTRFSKGVWSSRLRLYPEGLYEVLFPVPPIKEQRSIVAYIKKETLKLDALRATTERSISLLKERRAALIAAAVTGKLEIN